MQGLTPLVSWQQSHLQIELAPPVLTACCYSTLGVAVGEAGVGGGGGG